MSNIFKSNWTLVGFQGIDLVPSLKFGNVRDIIMVEKLVIPNNNSSNISKFNISSVSLYLLHLTFYTIQCDILIIYILNYTHLKIIS